MELMTAFKNAVLWITLFLCIGGSIWQCQDHLESYISKQVSITESVEIQSENLLFPAIYICPKNGYKNMTTRNFFMSKEKFMQDSTKFDINVTEKHFTTMEFNRIENETITWVPLGQNGYCARFQTNKTYITQFDYIAMEVDVSFC